MKNILIYVVVLFVFLGGSDSLFAQVSFELKDYVNRPDTTFEIISTTEIETQPGVRQYEVKFNSLSWLAPDEVSRQVWTHTMVVAIPDDLQNMTALMIINGGRNPTIHERTGNLFGNKGLSDDIAIMTKSIVAELQMIPNQPLVFHNDGEMRKEDDLIAYSWARFLENSNPEWVAQFPMTKASVRGMDVIAKVAQDLAGVSVEKFAVTGASKRGWTTWLVGAVDERVVGIAPIVIDVVNIVPSMLWHFESLGLWSDAVQDYVNHGIMDKLRTPEVQRLAELVDPYYLRAHLSEPKFIINAANDEFFVPDSGQFYLKDLPGDTYVRYVPNSGHFVNNFDVINSLIIFYDSISTGKTMPTVVWDRPNDWHLDVQVTGHPVQVTLWEGESPDHRDYRFARDMPKYFGTDIPVSPTGEYSIEISKPARGYKAYFLEVRYADGPLGYLKLSTDIKVSKI